MACVPEEPMLKSAQPIATQEHAEDSQSVSARNEASWHALAIRDDLFVQIRASSWKTVGLRQGPEQSFGCGILEEKLRR